jgi:hypothetical protein
MAAGSLSWLDGEVATVEMLALSSQAAVELAEFLTAIPLWDAALNAP